MWWRAKGLKGWRLSPFLRRKRRRYCKDDRNMHFFLLSGRRQLRGEKIAVKNLENFASLFFSN